MDNGAFDIDARFKHEDQTMLILMKRERKKEQDATIRCLLLTSVSTCFGHHYANFQEIKGPVTAFGVLVWFCWMWLVAVVGRCLAGCEHCEGFCSTLSYFVHDARSHEPNPGYFVDIS